MTNYEWIVTNRKEQVKDILAGHLKKSQEKVRECINCGCDVCDFRKELNNGRLCTETTKIWLEAEYEPPYKKGDIVLAYESDILVIKDINDNTVALVNRLKEPRTTYNANIKDIIKKVGNIYDE